MPSRSPAARAEPLIALDQVLRLSETGITTSKAVTGNEAFFEGHYPDFPVYPGVFVIEAVCQAARRFGADSGRELRLSEVISTRFLSPVLPGAVLECECACSWVDASTLQVKASCRTEESRTAEVRLLFEEVSDA